MKREEIEDLVTRQCGLVLNESSVATVLSFCEQGWSLFAAVRMEELKIAFVFHQEMEKAHMKVLHYQVAGYDHFQRHVQRRHLPPQFSAQTVGLYFIRD